MRQLAFHDLMDLHGLKYILVGTNLSQTMIDMPEESEVHGVRSQQDIIRDIGGDDVSGTRS